MTCLYFPLFNGFLDTLDEAFHGFGEGKVAYDECLLVELLNLGSYFQHAAALSVVVFRHVDASPRLEVGIEMELLTVQIADGGIADLAEVVRQYFRGQSHGYAFSSLGQQQGIFYGQCDRLLVATVV